MVAASQIWNQIDDAERCLVGGKFEDAASLASSIILKIRNSKFENPLGDNQLADMMNSAGMVIVQSHKELGRIKQVFDELKEIYGTIWAIPVQVFLTGASMQIAEGFSSDLKETMEEYLSKWEYMRDGGVHVLVEEESMKLSHESHNNIRAYVLSCAFYVEVAELYCVKLLSLVLHKTDLAISWAEKASLPEENRQDLLMRLQAMQSRQKLATERATQAATTQSSDGISSEIGNSESKGDNKKQEFPVRLIPTGSDQFNPLMLWFRSVKIKIGRFQFVIPSGKTLLLFCLIFWMSFLLRKRGRGVKRTAMQQIGSMKRALFDAWKLAFSVQMNPLAAVQQMPR
ncbi:hypothetical protein LUZ60_001657 [Juncus effusus]|nr:hypothetical protein LUZ60_001657 [Juncus effusus]